MEIWRRICDGSDSELGWQVSVTGYRQSPVTPGEVGGHISQLLPCIHALNIFAAVPFFVLNDVSCAYTTTTSRMHGCAKIQDPRALMHSCRPSICWVMGRATNMRSCGTDCVGYNRQISTTDETVGIISMIFMSVQGYSSPLKEKKMSNFSIQMS